MNKSKFLKKSLAMLLALMLVFAMIPLSASAAEGESVYFKDLYVDGQRAAVNGDQLSSDVVETTTVDLTVGTLNGAELYVDVKNTENDKPFPCYDLDLTDETVATKTGENEYQVGILVKVKDNPESDDAKIAMKGIERIDKEARCTCRRERGGYLGADMSTFSHSGHNEFALAGQNDFHCPVKICVKPGNEVK